MTSPICTVNGSTTGNGVNVASNSVVTIAIADTAGVNVWSLRCLSTDELLVASNITASLSINSITKVATFTSPTTTSGAAMIFESKVNGGLDINGRVDDSLTTRFGVFILTDNGSLRVGAFDETTEGSAAYGWLAKFNAGIRTAADSALTPTVTGTLPIVVSGPSTARVVAINAATTLLPGSMSAADKTLINAATNAATVSTLVKRDGSGNASFGTVFTGTVDTPGTDLVLAADSSMTLTLDITSTGNVVASAPLQAPWFKLASQVNLSRSLPMNWSACKVATVDSWDIDDTGNIRCTVQDAFANLVIECRFVNGSHITAIYIRNRGPGGGGDPLPANAPSFTLYRQLISTGINSVVGTVNATLDGTYRGTSRNTLIDLSGGVGHIVDSELYRYFLVITPEFGADSLAGHIVYNGRVDYHLPASFAIGMD